MSSLDVARISDEEILFLKKTLFNKDFSWYNVQSNVIDAVYSIINRASVEELALFISWPVMDELDLFRSGCFRDDVSKKLDSAKREFKKNYIGRFIESFENGTTDEFLGDLSYYELIALKVSIQNWNIFNSNDKTFLEADLQRCCAYLDERKRRILDKQKFGSRENSVFSYRTPAGNSERNRPVQISKIGPMSEDDGKLLGSDFGVVTNSDGSINITAIGVSAYAADDENVRTRFNGSLIYGGYFIENLGNDPNISLKDKALMLTEFALSSKSDSFDEVEEHIFNFIAGYLFDKELANAKVLDVPVMGIIRDRAPLLYDRILYMKDLGSVTIPEYSEANVAILENMFELTKKEKDVDFGMRAIATIAASAHIGGSKK